MSDKKKNLLVKNNNINYPIHYCDPHRSCCHEPGCIGSFYMYSNGYSILVKCGCDPDTLV